jgi:hypothetical protein
VDEHRPAFASLSDNSGGQPKPKDRGGEFSRSAVRMRPTKWYQPA